VMGNHCADTGSTRSADVATLHRLSVFVADGLMAWEKRTGGEDGGFGSLSGDADTKYSLRYMGVEELQRRREYQLVQRPRSGRKSVACQKCFQKEIPSAFDAVRPFQACTSLRGPL
jgi:hypothetical protein